MELTGAALGSGASSSLPTASWTAQRHHVASETAIAYELSAGDQAASEGTSGHDMVVHRLTWTSSQHQSRLASPALSAKALSTGDSQSPAHRCSEHVWQIQHGTQGDDISYVDIESVPTPMRVGAPGPALPESNGEDQDGSQHFSRSSSSAAAVESGAAGVPDLELFVEPGEAGP